MRVYLASRFSRLPELLAHKAELEEHGIQITSRWLLGGHEWVGTSDEEIPVARNHIFATEDLEDITNADVVVCFTESARSGPARGGRHFEAGYAYAIGKPIVVVGYRENVFYCLASMCFAEDWDHALQLLLNASDDGRWLR